MARSKQTGNKREKEKDRLKKRKEKEERREERKKHSTKGLGIDAIAVEAIVTENDQPPDTLPAAAPVKTDDTRIGKIAYLNVQKGYGFIRDAKVKENLFFNTSDLPAEMEINDLVTFRRVKSTRGSTATAIEKVA